jgi:hypothetical protein
MTTQDKMCPVCLGDIGEKDSCVTECGHSFCLKCILRASQENTACPLCRNVLVTDPPDSVYEHDEGIMTGDPLAHTLNHVYEHGYEEGRLDESRQVQEEITIEKQKAFDDGFMRGRSGAQEEIRRLRDELHLLQTKVKIPISIPPTPTQYMHTQEQYKYLPTTTRAEGMRLSPTMAPSWIRNHEAHGMR